jgi:hypothetical protein
MDIVIQHLQVIVYILAEGLILIFTTTILVFSPCYSTYRLIPIFYMLNNCVILIVS